MKKINFTLLLFITLSKGFSQSVNYWESINEAEIKAFNSMDIVPKLYKTYSLNIEALKQALKYALKEGEININNSNSIISIPMPNGISQKFRVLESPTMENDLQTSFQNIKTYSIKGLDDVYANGKIDITDYGFHAVIYTLNGVIYIDPYCKLNLKNYIIYKVNDLENKQPFDCLNNEDINVINNITLNPPVSQASCVGSNLKVYRLAIACTGEYATAATGLANPSTSQVLSQVVTSINRVNSVFETELSVRLLLVPTTTLVLFTNANTDPFTANNSAFSLTLESNNILSSNIGILNFDIGHTFGSTNSPGGGGMAAIRSVCDNSKAQAATTILNPTGDFFNIKYLCHEFGHQFGANHTFHSQIGACTNGAWNFYSSVEPGSGVTIMSYGGLGSISGLPFCGSDGISDSIINYYHCRSYDEIINFINSPTANCANVVPTTNNPPTVSCVHTHTIPVNTPFILTGSAIDPEGDALTYSWEETDLDMVHFQASWNSGSPPFFRSYTPNTSSSRIFPDLASILTGSMQSTKGEYLPTTQQKLNFRLTARDNKMGGGGVCYDTTQVYINSAGPFSVTSQNINGLVYAASSIQSINWSVNGTNNAPINCSHVNIYISVDAGNTFSLVSANTPNDGTENVIMPNVNSTFCRVKVESVGNIFFSINTKDFTIFNVVTEVKSFKSSGKFDIQLSPNPTTNNIKIDLVIKDLISEGDTRLNIIDVLGNSFLQESINVSNAIFSKSYDLDFLPAGFYFIEITDGRTISKANFIKQQ